MHPNVGDGDKSAVSPNGATANGHAHTGSNKSPDGLSSDAIKIESSLQEEEEKADDQSGTRSVSSDDAEGPQGVPLSNDKPNVCFPHLPLSLEH
jgi:hypothetical protein